MKSIYKLLSLISATSGIVGSFYFIIATLLMSNTDIKNLSGTHFNANPAMSKSLLSQRLDFSIGAILIAFAFGLQIICIISESRITECYLSNKLFWAIYIIVFLLLTSTFFIRNSL